MSFLSFNFALFLAVALVIFHFGRAQWRPAVMLVLSYLFYLGAGVGPALLLVAVTTGVYLTALWMERQRTERGKKAFMALGVTTLVLLLFAFKSATWLVSELGSRGATLFLLMPLGLSYYSFKMIGYLLDVYWEQLPAQRNFIAVSLYGSFFPQIVSGPIQRAGDFFNQFDKLKNPDAGEFLIGLRRILFGLFKKVVIADYLAAAVASVYSNPSRFSSLELLFGAYCFALQLYADFAGLTDIAIGIGQLFGVKGPENFDLPYYSPNIQVFWRRWHMSLTSWLTDYLFMPLRMSLRGLGTAGLCLALVVNLVVVGLWHGVTWSFFFFGLLNGVYLVVSVLTLKERNRFFQTKPALAKIRFVTGPLITFHLMVFALILFRAPDISSALNYMARIIPGWQSGAVPAWRFDPALLGVSARALILCLIGLLACDAITWAARRQFWIDWFFSTPICFRRALYGALGIAVLLQFREAVTFIYARF